MMHKQTLQGLTQGQNMIQLQINITVFPVPIIVHVWDGVTPERGAFRYEVYTCMNKGSEIYP